VRDSRKFNTLEQPKEQTAPLDPEQLDKKALETSLKLKKVTNRYQLNFAHQYAIPIKNYAST